MKPGISCVETMRRIPLYCYGEVTDGTEELLEAHLSECEDCKAELNHQRAMMALLDTRPGYADPVLLSECRRNLRAALHTPLKSWSLPAWLKNPLLVQIPFRVPIGALALVALGWFGARYTPEKFGGIQAGAASEPMYSSVRSVEPDSSGRIQIAVDDVRRRIVRGNAQDPGIQGLLLSAVREESNPGVRVESIGILKNRAYSEPVRLALLEAVKTDPNPGVRLKALEGLKPYSNDPAVRKMLAGVLLKDDNAGVRVQAIDLLTSHRDEALVGILQQVVAQEDNSYVRARCKNTLQQMKASFGTY